MPFLKHFVSIRHQLSCSLSKDPDLSSQKILLLDFQSNQAYVSIRSSNRSMPYCLSMNSQDNRSWNLYFPIYQCQIDRCILNSENRTRRKVKFVLLLSKRSFQCVSARLVCFCQKSTMFGSTQSKSLEATHTQAKLSCQENRLLLYLCVTSHCQHILI